MKHGRESSLGTWLRPRALLLGLAVWAPAMVPVSASAQTESLANGDVRCSTRAAFDFELNHVGPITTTEQVQCGSNLLGANASAKASASFERGEEQREMVSAEADAASSNRSFTSGGSAIAGLTYDLLITSRRAPPRTVDALPVTVHGTVHATALFIGAPSDGLAEAQGFASLFVDQGFERLWTLNAFARADAHGPNDAGGSATDVEKKLEVRVGGFAAPLAVTINASCSASAFNLAADCIASADPNFAFDQVAFDAASAAAGLPTFRLDEFFSFEFPPNMEEPSGPGPVPGPGPGPGAGQVPAPPAGLVVGLGLAVVGLRRVRRMSWIAIRRAQPFTAPAARPSTIQRWMNM